MQLSTFFLMPVCILQLTAYAQDSKTLLVANSGANNVMQLNLLAAESANADTTNLQSTEYIASLPRPDHMLLYETKLFLSGGDTEEDSGVYVVEDHASSTGSSTVESPKQYTTGINLLQPYGFDFDATNDLLYVSSFRTDQILVYQASTGDFIKEFTSKADGLCNGPNHLSIHQGQMYVTTQGSNTIDGTIQYNFESQIVVYDLETGEGEVFAQPAPMRGGLGYVGMLGCKVYCPSIGDDTVCRLVTSDFGGGLRVYDLDGTLQYAVDTTYTAGAATGSLSVDPFTNSVYLTGFVNETTPGVVMRYNVLTGKRQPGPHSEQTNNSAVFWQDENFVRPVGILVSYPTVLLPNGNGTTQPPVASTNGEASQATTALAIGIYLSWSASFMVTSAIMMLL